MLQWIKNHITHHTWYQRLIYTLEHLYLKDGKTSLLAVFTVLVRKIRQDELSDRAASVAFSFTLSVFPALIFLFTLIPYIPIPDMDKQIMQLLSQVLPYGIYREASATIYDIVSRPRGGLLSVGFVSALYLATNGMIALMTAFNRSYRTIERRNFFRRRWIATYLTFILVIVLLLAIALLITGHLAIDWLFTHHLVDDNFIYYLLLLLQYTSVFFVFFIAISSIYYVAPAITKRWRFFSYGSLFASILAILITRLFSYYINNFASYNKLYGSIGTLLGLMVWLYLLAIIILVGFEINASIDEAKKVAIKYKL